MKETKARKPRNSRYYFDRQVLKLIGDVVENPRWGAEIGIWEGKLSCFLLKSLPDLNMVMIDRFQQYSTRRKPNKIANKTQEEMNDAMKKAVVGSMFASDRRIVMVGEMSYAFQFIPDGLFDFIFFDGDHRYESVKRDITGYYSKVRPGGLVSGHDYGGMHDRSGTANVRGAIDEFAREHNYHVQVITKHRIWWFQKHER